MVVAKRQGREKLTKIEQRKVKGRSEHLSENLRWSKQHSWLAQFTQGRPRGRKKHIQRGAKGLSLSLSRALARSSTLFSSHLWVGMPSRFEDGFSCYLLNKIEL